MNGPNDVGDVKAIMADLRTGVERLLHAVENEQGTSGRVGDRRVC